MKNKLPYIRTSIAKRLRQLRAERRLTQTALARVIDVSQNWLSHVESGKGSLTAEQILLIISHYQLPLHYFYPKLASRADSILNSFIHLGVTDVLGKEDVFVDETYSRVEAITREVLLRPESERDVVSLSAVFVKHSNIINIRGLINCSNNPSYGRRLGWFVDNLYVCLGDICEREVNRYAYSTTRHIKDLHNIARRWIEACGLLFEDVQKSTHEDIFIFGPATSKAIEVAEAQRSAVSRKWKIITLIQPHDFTKAIFSINA